MDSNLVARVNVDAYCPKIRKKQQNVHSHVGCPKPSVWEMEITVYPLHGRQNTFDSSSSERPLFLPPFPIHTRWAAKQTRLGRNRCRQIFSIGAGL